MKQILNIYKPIGLTPLQLINKLRNERSELGNIKIGFAGRLDPLAHGVMLLMIGEETKNRSEYLGLPKEYEFEVLFGVSTDTYDALGILQNINLESDPVNLLEQINNFIKSKIGKQIQLYPPYSSKEVNGKPLFEWARENRMKEIEIPEREIEIYNFELLNISQPPSEEIHKKIITNIKRVDGDFRQKEILKKWNDLFKVNKHKKLTVAGFRINCSSGTYVRSIANEMGQKLGTGAIAFSIYRTKVGEYKINDSLKI